MTREKELEVVIPVFITDQRLCKVLERVNKKYLKYAHFYIYTYSSSILNKKNTKKKKQLRFGALPFVSND